MCAAHPLGQHMLPREVDEEARVATSFSLLGSVTLRPPRSVPWQRTSFAAAVRVEIPSTFLCLRLRA
jgi:hypothetical protein